MLFRSVLEDMEASTEITVFARTLTQYGHLLADDVIVTVFGRLNKSDERSSFAAQRIELVDDLEHRIPEVLVTLPQGFTQDSLGTLQDIIREYPGTSPVKISLSTGMVFDTGDKHLVDADKVIGPLRVNFGANSVRII